MCQHQLSFQVKEKWKHKICSHEQLQFAICVLILQLSAANQVVQIRKAFTGAPAKKIWVKKKLKLLKNSKLQAVIINTDYCYGPVIWTASRIQSPLAGHECLLTASARWSPCRYPGIHVSRMMWVHIYVPTYSVCIYQPKVKETNSRPCLCLCMSTYLHKLHDEIYELVLMHVLTMVVCY